MPSPKCQFTLTAMLSESPLALASASVNLPALARGGKNVGGWCAGPVRLTHMLAVLVSNVPWALSTSELAWERRGWGRGKLMASREFCCNNR